jgi:hypothetical protein
MSDNIYNSIKPLLDQFNNLLNEVNKIPNNQLLSNQYQLKKQCNIFKKYISIDKLKIEIFHINNNYYISKNFINLLTYEKSCFMELYRHIIVYLIPLPGRDLLKQNKILLNDSISINYDGINIELWNIEELNIFTNSNSTLYNCLNVDFQLIIDLMKSTNFNDDIIKFCGSYNYDLIEYCKFIFDNYELKLNNYSSDIDKLKHEYDTKIKELELKIKTLEMLILEKN